MAIISFEFKDRDANWRVHPFELGDFNLLVGLSGAGKTRTLKALYGVSSCAVGRTGIICNDTWKLEAKCLDGSTWVWSAEVKERHFVNEVISKEGQVYLERNEQKLSFMGQRMPALKDSESLISLFRDNGEIAPLFNMFSQVHLSAAESKLPLVYKEEEFKTLIEKCTTLPELQANHSPLLRRAYVLQTQFPDDFARLVEAFCDIFPTVVQIQIAPQRLEGRKLDLLVSYLYEKEVVGPTSSGDWSSGMLRTWLHILELGLYPADSVILIDEYENSLGVNCLPALTQLLRERAGEIQFIITSHHPYVINHVPVNDWHIVSRKGSDVTLTPASAISRLTGLSKQKAFTLLMSSRSFTESVQ